MLPASRAACVPVFIATPTSACASAGASLVPSPHIATSLPLACSSRISLSLASGVASARKSSTPTSAAMAAAVRGLSPVIITVRMPIRRSSPKRSRMPPLTMSLRCTTPSRRRSRATASGVPPDLRDPLGDAHQLARRRVEGSRCRRHSKRRRTGTTCGQRAAEAGVVPDMRQDRVDRALADRAAFDVDAAHPRLRAERREVSAQRRCRARAARRSAWRARRSSDPRAFRPTAKRAEPRPQAPAQ